MATMRPGPVVVSAPVIAARIVELAAAIDATFAGAERPVVLVCVLKGSLFFTADLARALTIAVEVDAVAVRSYGQAAETSGTVELVKDVSIPLRDRDTLVVEDIIDTGLTTSFLLDHLAQHRPRSLRLVTLLDKLGRRRRPVRIDFRGFFIPNRFVVGYGLDLDERWRNLRDVHVLAPDHP